MPSRVWYSPSTPLTTRCLSAPIPVLECGAVTLNLSSSFAIEVGTSPAKSSPQCLQKLMIRKNNYFLVVKIFVQNQKKYLLLTR